ncbi:uncharacterized protein PGTG_03808 [Puccinia graminis f. sp. tritici CRL 75-36-700-3]|uniref:Uncharacterized protein n=1 Tax=Puccinia graminis f. sp. tritici (strain CRL 75-36-700-3 / race SCCL) TaxID=418459 RepID=E3K0M7_PUCGT|nr:uncharacterized protein PGTG_03808 [Puccinia graminis f. sp. tritici CRL 75-36-700-3]EFP77852.1 hypothetical protein PGTG_03808 [Puccinia graminis f. sp. tritici CRL 75-36-700-3]
MSSSTCKQNHTRAEIDTNKAITASKKAEKAQKATQKLEAQRQKRSAKEARTALKGLAATTPTPRLRSIGDSISEKSNSPAPDISWQCQNHITSMSPTPHHAKMVTHLSLTRTTSSKLVHI